MLTLMRLVRLFARLLLVLRVVVRLLVSLSLCRWNMRRILLFVRTFAVRLLLSAVLIRRLTLRTCSARSIVVIIVMRKLSLDSMFAALWPWMLSFGD